MDEEFAEFFKEHDEDIGLKRLFDQSLSEPETSTSLIEMSATIGEIAAENIEPETFTSLIEMPSTIGETAAESMEMGGQKEEDSEEGMRIVIM